MENNTTEIKQKIRTNRKLVFYTALPAILVMIISMLLIHHYEGIYNISNEEHRLIWEAIRNLLNVLMVLIFIIINIIIFIKWKLEKEHISYTTFIIHFLISLSLLNFSYFPTELLFGIIKAIINSLPAAMNFEHLKK